MSCADCFKGEVHDHGTAAGSEERLYGRTCYVTPAPAGSASTSAILYLPDGFGLKFINNKLLADQYATQVGCRVIIPDVIPGGGMDTWMLNVMKTLETPVGWFDIWGQLNRLWAVVQAIGVMVPFLWSGRPHLVYPDVLEFARAVKADLPPGGKLGVVGFCWGGYGSTRLCTDPAVKGGGQRLIDAQFCAHPSFISADMVVDAVTRFKVPYSMAIGDKDLAMSEKAVHETEAALRQRVGEPERSDYQIQIYPGCRHGFAVRAGLQDQVTKEGAEKALEQAVNWFKKYL